jgi:hypothetical protein
MFTNKTRLAVLARLLIFIFAPHNACAAPPPNASPVGQIENRIDHYFAEPRSPETFRALSGVGLPAGATTLDSYPDGRWMSASTGDKELLQRLFPHLDISNQYWYPGFGGCRAEAPLQQFKDRVARLGAAHPYIAQWLRAERAVLSACVPDRNNAGAVASALPPPLDETDPAIALLQKQDRAYQQAAMSFYQGDDAAALAAFQVIADDRASPNRPLAAYMVLAIHAGSHAGLARPSPRPWPDANPAVPAQIVQSPQQSLQAIQTVLADPSLESIHSMAAALIGWIASDRAEASTISAQLNEAMLALNMDVVRLDSCPQCLKRYEAALSDIDFLRRNVLYSRPDNPDWVLTGKVPEPYRTSAALAALAKTEPMAAWVAFPTDAYRVHAWALAAKMPQSEAVRAYFYRRSDIGSSADCPWLHENPATSTTILLNLVDNELVRLKTGTDVEQHAAALSFDYYNLVRHLLMDSDHRRHHFKIALRQLQDFPYKETTMFDRTVDDSLQYLMTEGRLTEARRMRDALKLDQPEGRLQPYTSSAGALLILAEDEDHLVRVLATQPFYPREYLNHLATSELWRLAARSELDRSQRALFVRAAWSRDYAMGRTIGRAHDKLLRTLAPEITDTWQTPPGHDVKPDDISIVRDVLKSPGLNTVIEDFSRMPDDTNAAATATLTGLDHYNHNDNNWWCAYDIARHDAALDDTLGQSFRLDDSAPQAKPRRIRVTLSPALTGSYLFRQIDPDELVRLSKVECAPQSLSERVVAWVRKTKPLGSRAGQAEALADAVAATRWGCNRDGSHAAYSREAFQLLHSLFPASAEAKRTPYWFN